MKLSTWGIALYASGLGLILSAPVLTTTINQGSYEAFFVFFATVIGLVVLGTTILSAGLRYISKDPTQNG